MAEDESGVTEFIANPTQRLFIEHTPDNYDPNDRKTWGYKSIACMSSRMGEGKSCGLVWSCWYHTKANPGARWLLIRDTWVNCQATTQKEFFFWFPDGVFGRYIAGTKTFVWDEAATGLRGEVIFMGLDDEKDASKVASMPIAGYGIDEPSPAAGTGGVSEFIFTTLNGRLRQKFMKYYAGRLAQNNPDESHWTYKHFVDPGNPKFTHLQTAKPENMANLPPDYYKDMEEQYKDRPDLQRRFAKGEFGFQQLGKPVTPQWSDSLHLMDSIDPVKKSELVLLWDFGLNATCIITQPTPLGYWLILESHVMDDGGTIQLIEDIIKPQLTSRFDGFDFRHIGDPAGRQREQSDSSVTAVKTIKRILGGKWKDGPKSISGRVNPLDRVLSKLVGGVAMVQVDRIRAKHVWHALRGGWHYKMHPGGVTSPSPIKNNHSHPGDAMGYGAGVLYPGGQIQSKDKSSGNIIRPKALNHFGRTPFLGNAGKRLPDHGDKLGAKHG